MAGLEINQVDKMEAGEAASKAHAGEREDDLKLYMTRRERLSKLLHSHKFQVCVIVLVVVDCLLVIAEMLIDLKMLELHESHHAAPHVLHYMSIAILSIFIVEIIAKLYAYGLSFFHHKLEVLDAIVVLLSFVLDIVYSEQEGAITAVGLVIVVRLWRVARVLNGIVLSVKTQAEHKILKERKLRGNIEQELHQAKNKINTLESEVYHLHQILQENDIKCPPTIVDMNVLPDSVSEVKVELNTML